MNLSQSLIERFNVSTNKGEFIEEERDHEPLVCFTYDTYEYWLMLDLTVLLFTYGRKIIHVSKDITSWETYNETIEECADLRIREELLIELAKRYQAMVTEATRTMDDSTEKFRLIAVGNY